MLQGNALGNMGIVVEENKALKPESWIKQKSLGKKSESQWEF